jgi:hypothetical protein
MTNQYTANKVPPTERTNRIGDVCTRGGIITLDQEVPEFFKELHVGGTGDLIVLGIDGNYIPYKGLLAGAFVKVLGNKVVSAATVDGVAMTTTATNITWHGGI